MSFGSPYRRSGAGLGTWVLLAGAGLFLRTLQNLRTVDVGFNPQNLVLFRVSPTLLRYDEARYRVREQLMGANLPNDAIGKTSEITGTILAYPDGRIVKDSSKIIIHLDSLKSDKDRRDGFLRRRTLETEKYPTVELIPTEVRGFSGTLPASGTASFQLLGDLVLKGVPHPTVWNVTARAEGQNVAGSASTQGTSTRTPRQVLLARHMKAGSQLTPDSISTTLRFGNLPNTPS